MYKFSVTKSKISFLLISFLLTQAPAQAHHSITGEFDTEVSFELRGTITKLDWANPHLWYYLDVITETGSIEKWQCTTGLNPNRLIRAGWKKTDLPMGIIIRTQRSNPARDKSNTCIVGGITLDDGTPIFSGTKT
jgi:Family of unknown function (DUF6152)